MIFKVLYCAGFYKSFTVFSPPLYWIYSASALWLKAMIPKSFTDQLNELTHWSSAWVRKRDITADYLCVYPIFLKKYHALRKFHSVSWSQWCSGDSLYTVSILGHCKMMLNSIDAHCTDTISISNLWAMETCLSSSSMISV